ncbi:TPA: hypothetical protein PXM26_002024 [Yersinia enterocolitica]|nr:hypothetical protein [Yersinia enterocolitica]HDL7505336.1 hypothetical protein [Yersinia enterocolitica]
MARIDFREVSITRVRAGKCDVCGKRCQQKKKFYQTLNQFNKNSDGAVKSRDEILLEVKIEGDKWLESSLRHEKCKAA